MYKGKATDRAFRGGYSISGVAYLVAHARSQPVSVERRFALQDLDGRHVDRLSDRGPDEAQSVAALCPNCHRRVHNGEDATDFSERLTRVVHEKEVPAQRS